MASILRSEYYFKNLYGMSGTIKNHFLFIFILTITIAIFEDPIIAGTYYVSPSGNNSNPGTISSPWKTIGKAAGIVLPGDTVYIRGGIYPEYITIIPSGSAGNPILFEAYPGEIPVIDGSGKTTNPANPWAATNNLISVYGNYVIIRGLELKNSAGFGIYVNASYCVVDRVHVHNGYFAGVYFYMCSFDTVKNSVVHDFYDYGTGGVGGGGNADGMGASAGNSQPFPDYGHHVFRNNLVYNTSDDGIDTWSSRDNIVENNIVHHAGYGNKSNGGSKPVTWDKPMGNGNGFKCGGGSTSGNNILRNNISYNNVTSGFDENGGAGNKYYNNTAFSTSIGFRNISDATAVNNLSYSNSSDFTGGSQNMNSWDLGITNPEFMSTDPDISGFLRLSPGSQAIDAGMDLSSEGVLTDKIGTPRPQVAGFDLGAYEWSPSIDNISPVIYDLDTSNLTKNSITISWTTDEISDSQLEYGPTNDYGSLIINPGLKTDHSLNIEGLSENTLYHFRVISNDKSGNFAVSDDYSFTTILVTGICDMEQSAINLYPNPARYGNNITVKSDISITGYTIYDMNGNLVEEKNGLSDNYVVLKTDFLTSGIYMLRLNSDKKVFAFKKFIIQK
jgi:parallel beta-helix repeat protein